MSDEENEKQIERVEKLGAALGQAWGRCGFKGPPRFVMIVADDKGKWRLASTEQPEVTADVLEGVLDFVGGDVKEVTHEYTDGNDLS